ncbi:hypothetical protein [Streptomyces sp. MMBL 11-1]|uniref:hypothetical protein n=1 Tax=Streptomyces sp. MMBL 11-1 TaxID=3026420 RepID=UPI00235EC8A6|nr:hypothetical protein [Streptomyces sp. MMBL 11-1]
MAAEEVKRVAHGDLGFATCLPDTRWDANEFVQSAGHALVGLVPLRFWELREKTFEELLPMALGASRIIGEKGDIFQFHKGQQRKGWRPSGVLAELVTAYAVLALNTPDTGVTRFAFHACFWVHEGCPKNADG